MTAALNQDFVTYVGDAISPIFTVQTSAGVAIDISTCSEISWFVERQEDSSILLTKTKTAGGIVFVTNGTDGKFQVKVLTGDTAALSGFYIHYARVIDNGGNPSTVTIGRMQVGLKPMWTYDPTSLATVSLYQVRLLVGDVIYSDQQIQDGEINWLLTQSSNVYSVAAQVARSLAAKFARMVDIVQGEMKTNYSAKSRAYAALAASLDAQGKTRTGTMMYAGGISQGDKTNQVQDTDRVTPQFNIEMDDNLLPISPVGQQTPGSYQQGGQP